MDRAIRERAAKLRKSVNQVILDELTEGMTGHRPRTDFSDLVGRWTPDSEFDQIVLSQRQIDPSDWA